MSRRRRILANAVVLTILGGASAAIVSGKELWPFSPYPMFSIARTGPTVAKLWVYGVLADGGEVPLTNPSWFRPLRLSALLAGLGRLRDDALKIGLTDVLSRYEERRRGGLHQGPPLAGLRLYRMTFALDPDPAGRDRPLERVLLGETPLEAR